MKKFIKICILFATLNIVATSTLAAEDDFGVWSTLKFSAKIIEGLKIKFEDEFRTADNANRLKYIHLDIGLQYSPLKWLVLGAQFREVFELQKRRWIEERRPHLNILFKHTIFGIGLSNRSRFAYRFFPSKDDGRRYRNQTSIKYKISVNNIGIIPYVADESFVDILTSELNRNRFYIGSDVKFLKNYSVGMFYLLQTSIKDDGNSNSHVLGFRAGLSF